MRLNHILVFHVSIVLLRRCMIEPLSKLLNRVFYSANELSKDQVYFFLLAFLLHCEESIRLIVQVKVIDDWHEVFVVHIDGYFVHSSFQITALIRLIEVYFELDNQSNGFG